MLLEQKQLLFRHQECLPYSLDLFKTKQKNPTFLSKYELALSDPTPF